MISTINSNSVYLMWLRKIVTTHLARAWDLPRSDEEEEQDEWFNDLWPEMDEIHQERLWGLSSDLQSLRDKETVVQADWEPMPQGELQREQAQAFQGRDWDRLLTSLRRPPRFRSQADTDYARGRAWMELGHPEVAVLFFDNASRLEPANLAFTSLALECLKAIPDWPEALARAERYRLSPETHSRLLFRAGDIFHLCAYQFGEAANYEKAIQVVDRGLALLKSGTAQESVESIIAGAYATKALSLQHLNRQGEALIVLDEAVASFPENTTLITARGLLRQELGRPDALDDLREAAKRGTPLVWTYLELARNAIKNGDHHGAIEMSRQGLARVHSDAVAAVLFEFMAIAMFNLGVSPLAVRNAFAAAIELDPLNQDVQVNRQIFEDRQEVQSEADVQWQLSPGTPMNALSEMRAQMFLAAA